MEKLIKDNDEEWQNRLDLAASYHLAHHFGWSDIIWNHITARTSSIKNTFLINNFGLRYDEITASNLLEVNHEGEVINGEGRLNDTGYIIHGAVHKSRKDVNCVMHTHSRAGLAISCLEEGLRPITQDAAMFHNSVSYHDWEGMSTNKDECERLTMDLGINNVMILRNHGLLTCGKTVSEAFMLMYYLDKACKHQIDTLSTGKKTIIPSDHIMKLAASQYQDTRFTLGKHEWPSLLRLLNKNNSIYNH